MNDDAVTAVAQAAERSLREAARLHKQAEFSHRKQARRLARSADEFRALCERLGCEYIPLDTGQGGHSQ